MQIVSLLPPFSHHLPLLLLSVLSLAASLSRADYQRFSDCAPIPYSCGDVNFDLTYPFRVDGRNDYCGHPGYYLNCTNNSNLTITISNSPYQVKLVDGMNHLLTIVDTAFVGQSCPDTYKNTTIDTALFQYAPDRTQNLTLYYNCAAASGVPALFEVGCLLGVAGSGQHSYYRLDNSSMYNELGACSSWAVIAMARTAAEQLVSRNVSFGDALRMGFVVRWTAGQGWCTDCAGSGGVCGFNITAPDDHTCFCPDGPAVGSCDEGSNSKKKNNNIIIAAAASAAAVGFVLAGALGFLCYRHKKRRQPIPASTPLFRDSSFKSSFTEDPEFGKGDYQTHIFSYHELQEATDHFNADQELGDGGYGTVYKGKLRDGRTVAVKRLYDSNFKRVEQFINEVAILSRLRHQNLVNLYGCTSRQSRELLLVYEFVSNGTVADHIHGPRAAEGGLSWPRRISIAVETAEALAYLHAVEPPIIHRDVKTNNILLDDGFHVKVADFGLSRLVPTDATHVSTAPQGTPGYLDPEYYQCYQLTDKSDVYSFGVVLVELISSKQAVDVSRGRNEINLATMAVNRIQKRELEELVDPGLGYESDWEMRRVITVVAELAFRCLQMDRDMRPPIKEVLEVLTAVKSGAYKSGEDDVGARDDVGLLKNTGLFSPDTVTEKWASRSTTPNSSG